MSNCPCGSEESYQKCCEPYLSGRVNAPTAEALMRSRYTAFTKANIDYLIRTHHPRTRDELDIKGTKKWAEESKWLGLEVIRCEKGTEQDDHGIVEFKVRLQLNGEDQEMHELSEFLRKQGEWYFVDGKSPNVKQYRRESPKLGRNDPCSCGSGKKYKKCCGAVK